MKTALIGLVLMTFVSAASAQDLGAYEEVTAGNYFGLGARQMAMGGTGIASSWDGAALYYNPAALSRIHRIEFQMSLSHQKFSNETTQPPDRYTGYRSIKNSATADQTKTRLSGLNLSLPAPTYRGSLVLAFGINRVASFDRTALYNVIDDSSGYIIEDYGKEFETGGIYAYSAGVGVDISPHLSLGLTASVYSGDDKFVYDYSFRDDALDEGGCYTNHVTESYIGIALKGGLLAQPNADFALGLTIESPLDYQVEYTYDGYEGQNYLEYDLTRPFIFGAGVAYRIATLTVTGDAEYADWSQLSYNDNSDQEVLNDTLSMIYRDVLSLRAGAEYQIPTAGLALRAGMFSQPLPYHDRYIKSDRKGYTFGFGWLMDKVLMLEAAYVRGTFSRYYTAANADYISNDTASMVTAEDTYSRLFVTLSYRY